MERSTRTACLFRTREELCAECQALFGEGPFCTADPQWCPRNNLESLTVPVVFVSGGQDPWLDAGLEVNRQPARGKHFHVPDGGHCHDRYDRKLGQEVVAEMLKWAEGGAKSTMSGLGRAQANAP